MTNTELFIRTANANEIRTLAEQLGIVNDDHSLDDFLSFLWKLVSKLER